MKKLLILLSAFFIAFSIPFTGFAETVQPDAPSKTIVTDIEIIKNAVERPNPDSTPAQNTHNKSQDSISPQAINTITPFFARSGDTPEVHVYLVYSGGDLANAIKFTSLKINNTSLLSPSTYTSFPGKIYNFGIATTFYNVPIGIANIPTDVTKVRVSDSGLMAYMIEYGWSGFSNIIGEWPIY